MHILLIPLLRTLSDGKFHSGTDLAQEFGVSRATISNVLKHSVSLGITIHKIHGRGYQLPRAPDWLCSTAIEQQLLATGITGFTIETIDHIDSTNSALMRAHEPALHRHCLVAEIQSAGRGRRGRIWQSTLGGSLTCSVRWRFNQSLAALAGLSLAVGVALIRTLQHYDIHDVQLKWPNDVVWKFRKLAGILIEVHGETNGPAVAVIGIGINLRLDPAMRAAIDQPVTDLTEIKGPAPARNKLVATLLQNLEQVLTEFEMHGLSRLRDEWQAAHAYAGKSLRVSMTNGNEVCGTAVGLSDTGALLLHTVDDRQIAVHSGEVQLSRQSA